MRETVTRAGGGFAFGGLGAGRYAVRASSGVVASATARAIEAGDGAAAAPVPLELSPGRAVAGRVIDDAGAALADVPVRIESDTGAPGRGSAADARAVRSGGHFTALVSPGWFSALRLAAPARAAAGAGHRRPRPGHARASADQGRARAGARRARVREGARSARRRGGGGARALPRERDRGSDGADRTVAAGRGGGGDAFGRGAGARLDARHGRRQGRAFRRRRPDPGPLPRRGRAWRGRAAAQRRVRDGAGRAPRRGKLALRPGFGRGPRHRRGRRPDRRGARRGRRRRRLGGVRGAVRADGRGGALHAGAAGGKLPAVRERRRPRHRTGRGRRHGGTAPPALEIKLLRAEAGWRV